jgi:Acetyltransferase (GNAT) domain
VTTALREAFAGPHGNTAGEYRSIAFESGAPLEKYLGWVRLVDEPGLKTIVQRRGPVRRCLILAQGIQPAQIDEMVRRLQLLDARTDLVLHDFDDPGRDERTVGGRPWRRASTDERILNKATFVFNLACDDEALIAAMSGDCRRKLRKAREAGLRVEVADHPAPKTLREFFANFEAMGRERGLRSLDRAAIQRMFDGGDLTLFHSLAGEESRSAATIYRAGDKAIFMIGVGHDRRNDGAGQLLHFEIMRDLRARGLRWYDFGGIPSTDENDGIFRFKKGFGGRFVSLGTEYFCRPPLVRALVNIKRRVAGVVKAENISASRP